MGGVAAGGHKGSPCIQDIQPGQVVELLNIEGCGTIRHIWLTFETPPVDLYRSLVIRMYWDGQEQPSVESPVGDFFGISHMSYRPMHNELMSVQSSNGLNCFIPMPFRKSAKITIENDSPYKLDGIFYQVDYTLGDIHPENLGFFHAQFRRANCQPFHTDYVILDGIKGQGRYLGTLLGIRSVCLTDQWWGEGEVKMYFDGEEQPTICGTGTEDYVGCAWGIAECITPTQGCIMTDHKNKLYSFFRWHTHDPICFEDSFKITIMQMGFARTDAVKDRLGEDFVYYPAAGATGEYCYFDRSDDFSSVAYWYQTLPTAPFPPLPSREERIKDLTNLTTTAERHDI